MISIVLILFILVYAVTIAQLIYGFGKIKTIGFSPSKPETFFSIVVPFRDESANIPLLLESIRNLDYPDDLFEIILIDDFSSDDSVRKIYNWRMENGRFQTTLLENIQLSNSPKKDAISRAIPIIKLDWLITTDADCVLPQNWLLAYDQFIRNTGAAMVVGAVTYECKKYSLLQQFQQLDLTSLQGTTIGSLGLGLGFMCNGANFGYTKLLFNEVGGFEGNNKLGSGDDVFLLQKAVQHCPEKVQYLKSKSAIVHTKPMPGWNKLFQQRLRWASKTGSYQSIFGKDLAVIVFLGNLALLAAFGLCLASSISWPDLILLFVLKVGTDFILLYKTNRFISSKRLRFVLVSSLIYPFFCVAVALCSLTGNYEWKGRRFKS